MPKKDYPSRDQRMKDLTQRLEQGIREVFDSGKYTEYLAAMSRFHRYLSAFVCEGVLFITFPKTAAKSLRLLRGW